MPVPLTYPGVYIEEIPSGVHTITGVSTSVTAFIGRALKGPSNQAVIINGYADFQRIFGGLWVGNYLGYAVRDFFLNGGNQAIIVRVYDAAVQAGTYLLNKQTLALKLTAKSVNYPGAAGNNLQITIGHYDTTDPMAVKTASDNNISVTDLFSLMIVDTSNTNLPEKYDYVTVKDTAISLINLLKSKPSKMLDPPLPSTLPAAIPDSVFSAPLTGGEGEGNNVTSASTALACTVKSPLPLIAYDKNYPGAAGNNLQVTIGHYGPNDKKAQTQAAQYNLQVSDLFSLVVVDTLSEKTETYDYLTVKSSPNSIDKALANSTLVRIANAASNLSMIKKLRLRDTLESSPLPDFIPDIVSSLPLAGGSDGTSPTTASITLDCTNYSSAFPLAAASEGAWGNNVQVAIDWNVSAAVASRYGLQPSDLFNLTVVDTSTTPKNVERYHNLTVKDSPARVDKVLISQSNLIQAGNGFVNTLAVPNPTNNPVNLSNGQDGGMLQEADVLGDPVQKTGLYALDDVDIFNLLCIPGYNATNDVDLDLLAQAAAYCETRKAFFIIDAPSAWTSVSSAQSGIAALGVTSKNAAVFFPRIQQPDPLLNNQIGTFLPCGMIAGTMARIDGSQGIWKAPAGLEANLQGITQLTVKLTDAENGELNPLAINCLRIMPAAGTVIWGSRTLQGNDLLASEWKYIPVRRLALYIEQSVYRGTQWVVFQPNTESLWAQIRLNIGSFMQTLFRQGAFQGNTPQKAYFVKCDSETTTQDDIDRGIVNIVVGFAPVKPAEFVVIMIQQIVGQS